MKVRMTAHLALALWLAACGPGPPQSLDEAIERGLSNLHLTSPTEVLRREDGDRVLVVFLGQAGVLDGAGVLVLDRVAPWTIHHSGVGDASRAEPGWALMSGSGDGSETETLVYGPITDVRIRSVVFEFTTGPVTVEARSPAFAAIIRGSELLPSSWRFVDGAGVVVYDPFAPRATPTPEP